MHAQGSGDITTPLLDRRFLGLAMMEFWERFAMAGVKSLLVLLLVDQVFAGDTAQAAWAGTLRAMYEGWFGRASPVALASQVYGYAGALLYLSVPVGGLIGDLFANRRVLVHAGAAAMLVGLLLMVQVRGFLPGLALFMAATGTVKGNLSVQLGQLYPDEALRQRGYAAYLGFLNGGVICGPLVCGTLAALAGWSYALGAAALAVAIGMVGYAASGGRGDAAAAQGAGPRPDPARVAGSRATAILITVILSVYFCWAAYEQLGDIFLVWARGHIALHIAGWQMPVGWFASLDGLFTLLLIAMMQALMPWLARRGVVLGADRSIMLGGVSCACGYGLLALASAGGGTALSMLWALGYILLIDIAVVLVWPSGLSLIAAVAPPRYAGWWTGIFYLHGFFASLWAGLSGSFYGHMPDTRFWLLQAGVAGGGVLLALIAVMLVRDQATTTSA